LDTGGAGVHVEAERGAESHVLDSIAIRIGVPQSFPDKYHDAIVRAAGLCFIKQQLCRCPEITTTVVAAEGGL
jgi:hypothetical protein